MKSIDIINKRIEQLKSIKNLSNVQKNINNEIIFVLGGLKRDIKHNEGLKNEQWYKK
mgnify:CR=1 FL=1